MSHFGDNRHVDGGQDSYYEMLLKLWIQGGRQEADLKIAFDNSIAALRKYVGEDFAGGTALGRLKWVGFKRSFPFEEMREHVEPKAGHLSCFLPGTVALGLSALA